MTPTTPTWNSMLPQVRDFRHRQLQVRTVLMLTVFSLCQVSARAGTPPAPSSLLANLSSQTPHPSTKVYQAHCQLLASRPATHHQTLYLVIPLDLQDPGRATNTAEVRRKDRRVPP